MAATHFNGPVVSETGFQNGASSYESLITTKAIEATDNGKTFGLNLAAGFTVTLPALSEVTAGFSITFRVEIQPTTAYIITEDGTADTNTVVGVITTSTGHTTAAAFASDTPVTFLNFVATAGEVGDWATVSTNGTNWFVRGVCQIPTGITLA